MVAAGFGWVGQLGFRVGDWVGQVARGAQVLQLRLRGAQAL